MRKITKSDLENVLNFKIEGYNYFPFSDLTDNEIETMLESIEEGCTSGEFKTLSGLTDDDVLLTWNINCEDNNFNSVNGIQLYIEENFNNDFGYNLVRNTLEYAANICDEDERYNFLSDMLDGIGLSDSEIKKFSL